jgi:hypothetical protein
MGDLVWIPQATVLYKHSNKDPMAIKFLEKPSMGIIVDSKLEGYVEVLIENVKWTIETRQCRKLIKECAC